MKMPSFSRIVRFRNKAGKVFYGEVPGIDLATQDTLTGRTVAVYTDYTPYEEGFILTKQQERIAEVRAENSTDHKNKYPLRRLEVYADQRHIVQVLAPLAAVPIFECIGINYLKHVQETGVWFGLPGNMLDSDML